MPVKKQIPPRKLALAARTMLASSVVKTEPPISIPEDVNNTCHANVGRKLLNQQQQQHKKRYRWMTPQGAVTLPGLPYRGCSNGHIPLPTR